MTDVGLDSTDEKRLVSVGPLFVHCKRDGVDLEWVTNRGSCAVNLKVASQARVEISTTTVGVLNNILLSQQVGMGDTDSWGFPVATGVLVFVMIGFR